MSDSFNEKYFNAPARRRHLPCTRCGAITRVTENTNVFTGDCDICGELVEYDSDLRPRLAATGNAERPK